MVIFIDCLYQEPASKKSKEQEGEYQAIKETSRLANDISIKNERVPCIPTEDVAAIRIQTAFRGFMVSLVLIGSVLKCC